MWIERSYLRQNYEYVDGFWSRQFESLYLKPEHLELPYSELLELNLL